MSLEELVLFASLPVVLPPQLPQLKPLFPFGRLFPEASGAWWGVVSCSEPSCVLLLTEVIFAP